ncbi:MAG: HAD hydrolase-like protein [Patescibacteria group bacterium]
MTHTIVFDWKRTLYDPDKKELITGAAELLNFLKEQNINMILIGKGGDEMHEETQRLEVEKYFQKTIFQEGKKEVDQYISFIKKENPEDTIFIGDRVRCEIEIGNTLGATTIWIKQGKFAGEEPENQKQEPTHTVHSLEECLELVKEISQNQSATSK